jgi:hypothetical protein
LDADATGHAGGDGFNEVVRHYNLWREIIRLAGTQQYDDADWDGGRLYFRSDYVDRLKESPEWKRLGDWAAWIIEPTPQGYYNVLRSLWHERAPARSEDTEAAFSEISDAGKYMIAHIGNGVRLDLKMESLAIKWDEAGLDPRIQVTPAPQQAVDYMLKAGRKTDRELMEKYLRQYTFTNCRSCYAFTFPSNHVYMQVLALSYEELNASLIDGMPETIASQIPFLADRLGVNNLPS